jgi:hypothetical protein
MRIEVLGSAVEVALEGIGVRIVPEQAERQHHHLLQRAMRVALGVLQNKLHKCGERFKKGAALVEEIEWKISRR